ncbi:MAG: enoyl-ACP reductase [bacterium]
MGSMEGKRGIIFGIANERSYAWYIAKALLAEGAECLFTHIPDERGKMRARCLAAINALGIQDPWLEPCDVTKDDDLDTVFTRIRARLEKIDFIVHSIAFADRQYLKLGNFHTTTREAWTQALDVSAYSLLAMAQRAIDVMPNGGAVVGMTYYGGEKVIPGYNVMGVAKAALEHTARYLAHELGEKSIRINLISGGPLRTLAASAVGGISTAFELQERKSSLRRNITGEEVGKTAVYLLSDMSGGVTGETIHVDAGFSIVGP